MKSHLVTLLIISSFIAASAAENPASEPVLHLVYPDQVTRELEPVFVCDDFTLVKKSDVERLNIRSREIFPRVTGDYYVMRILDPEKLSGLDETLPYILIGNSAVFKTDPAGAEVLSNYGWGLTRITFADKADRYPPEWDVVLEYDPDIAAMISGITDSSCQSAITPITSFSTRYS